MVYLVEDDSNIRELVVYTLNHVGIEAKGFALPSAFWDALHRERPALVILDVMLPEQSGLDILDTLRKNASTQWLPVMMLTARGTEYDKVVSLDAGADDYVTKPFGMMELVSRVKALLRRTAATQQLEEYRVGALYVCPEKHLIQVDGADVTLTHKEFDLLCLFLRHPGLVLTRDQLLDQVWGYAFDGQNRTVDVHIRTLRQKLGAAAACIETVRGIGYKLEY